MVVSVLAFLLFLVPVTLFTPNLAGSGLNFPPNILQVAALFIFFFFAFLRQPGKRDLAGSVTAAGILLATVLALLPLPFTAAPFFAKAAWRAGAIAVGVFCYFALLQLPLTAPRNRQRLLTGILLLISSQVVIGLLQMFFPACSWVPDHTGRPYGIFQQVNLFASCLATGLAVALMLTILPGFRCLSAHRESVRLSGLLLLQLVLAMLIIWVQSRAAWLGAAVTVLLLLVFCGHYDRRRSLLAATVIVAGVLLAVTLLQLGELGIAIRDASGSNHARWTMLRDTLRMIALHPFRGWGYGSFEYAFQHFRVTQPVPTLVTETAGHPHNEILLWWVEGGLAGLAAMLILLAVGVRLFIRARRTDQQQENQGSPQAGQATALCLTLLPVLVHTQLEWPLYMSAFHAVLLLVLLAASDRASEIPQRFRPASPVTLPILRAGVVLFSVLMVVIAAAAWRGQQLITAVELDGFRHPQQLQRLTSAEKWLNQPRWQYDQMVALLLAFNNSRDAHLLERYRQWATAYLRHTVDASVYHSLISVLRFQQRAAEAEQYRQMAQRLYPRDARFRLTVH